MNKTEKIKTAYLCGPMEFAAQNGRNWRLRYSKALEKINIKCIIPEFEEKHITTEKEMKFLKENDINRYIEKMRQLIALDLKMVEKADLIITRWNGETMSGTIGEAQHAFLLNKPIYLVTQQLITTIPGWFLACFSNIFKDFKSLKKYLQSQN
jgi:nucleoside 2-deoxyribosyltransferase